jgi:CBS domain-containing protein
MLTLNQLLEQKGRTVYAVSPGAPVIEAVRIMADSHVGALLVMQGDTLLGIISERDYARKVVLRGRSSSDTLVREIMSAPVVTAPPDYTVHQAMQVMTDRRVRHLPVIQGGLVQGVVSIGDLVKCVIEAQQHHIEDLETYIHG